MFLLKTLELHEEQLKIFEELYTQHYSDLVYFAKVILHSEHKAEEITQEAFITVIEKIKSKELNLANRRKARNYMITIVKNKALTVLMKDNVCQTDDIEDCKEKLLDPKQDFGSALEAKENIKRWLGSFSEEERDILLYHLYDGWTLKEIAIAKGINENTVRSKFFRTKNKLVKLITKEVEYNAPKTQPK